MNLKKWAKLSAYLKQRSKEICRDNDCTADNHNCESYAYIAEAGNLIDICVSDYFQGWGSADEQNHGGYAAIMLPWTGTAQDLKEAVAQDSFMG